MGHFRSVEAEIIAGHITRFCQMRDSWAPFSHAEFNAFCEAEVNGFGIGSYGRLTTDEFVRLSGETDSGHPVNATIVELSLSFVANCYSTDAKPLEAAA